MGESGHPEGGLNLLILARVVFFVSVMKAINQIDVGICNGGRNLCIRVTGFGRIWADLGEFGRIWADLGEFGQIRANSGGFGRIWANSGGFGRIWANLG
jgi:hypothetical protein